MAAKPPPQPARPGHTANVLDQVVIDRTSQKGSSIAVQGRILPIIALRSASPSPVTATSARIGLPTPPKPTGAVLAIRPTIPAPNPSNPSPTLSASPPPTGPPP